MKIKTSELTGAALDWAVAKCEGKAGDCEIHAGNIMYGRVTSGFVQYRPSTDWAQGGLIIEREGISLTQQAHEPGLWWASFCSALDTGQHSHAHYATTPLIAAMRTYVASKLGDEVGVPEATTIQHSTATPYGPSVKEKTV